MADCMGSSTTVLQTFSAMSCKPCLFLINIYSRAYYVIKLVKVLLVEMFVNLPGGHGFYATL